MIETLDVIKLMMVQLMDTDIIYNYWTLKIKLKVLKGWGFGVLPSGSPDVSWAVASQQDGSGASVHLQRPTRAFTS